MAVAKERLSILDSDVEWSEGGADIDSLEDQLRDEEDHHLKEAVARGELDEEEAAAQLHVFPSAKQHIEGWQTYHLHDTSATAAVKSTCNIDDNRYLREDAANLAAYLYWLKLKQLGEYRRIVSTIRLAAPYFDDFVLAAPQRADDLPGVEAAAYGCLFRCRPPVGRHAAVHEPDDLAQSAALEHAHADRDHPLAIRLLAEMLDAASDREAGGPENINQGKETHPSKRLERYGMGFRKTGAVALLQEIGIDAIRRVCPHFNNWLTHLEKLGMSV